MRLRFLKRGNRIYCELRRLRGLETWFFCLMRGTEIPLRAPLRAPPPEAQANFFLLEKLRILKVSGSGTETSIGNFSIKLTCLLAVEAKRSSAWISRQLIGQDATRHAVKCSLELDLHTSA